MSIFRLTVIFVMLVLISGCLGMISGRVSDVVDYYVSPQGSDAASGTREAPLQTLHHAKERAVATIHESSPESVTIWLTEGIHTLSRTLEIFPEDNLQGKSKLVFKAFPGTGSVVSGGVKLSEWSGNGQGIWQTTLSGQYNPSELFVDGSRAIKARHPNTGYLRVRQAGEDRRTNFLFEPGDFPVPAQLSDVHVVLFHDWSISRMPLANIDIHNNRISAIDSIGVKGLPFFNLDNWEAHPRYYLEGAPEFLDMEMEWVFDAESRILSLKLPEGVDPASMNITIPVLEGLIRFNGNPGNPVRNISFEGLTFSHSAWNVPEWGYNGVQACHFDDRSHPGKPWSVVSAAISGDWMSSCRFDGCKFTHLGGSGLWIGSGSEECTVSRCHFEDISGNGIMIGEGSDRKVDQRPWYEVVPDQVARGNTVEYSMIQKCGARLFGAVGIWCGLTAETTIQGNEISDLPYTAISIGWMWNDTPTPARDNVIENNHIYHILQKLSDGGGIYSLGLQPGSRLTGNHIHDVKINTGRAESNGMFLDEGTTDIVVSHNLIYNIARSPLRFHRAGQNKVENNFLFTTADVPPIMYNATPEENILKVSNRIFDVEPDISPNFFESYIAQWMEEKDH